jgi:hypothetical protein
MVGGQETTAGSRADLDFAGFAQEFLRRNLAYARDYLSTMRIVAQGAPHEAQEVMARRWGLCFSLRTGRPPSRPTRFMAGVRIACHRHPRRSADRMRRHNAAQHRRLADHPR